MIDSSPTHAHTGPLWEAHVKGGDVRPPTHAHAGPPPDGTPLEAASRASAQDHSGSSGEERYDPGRPRTPSTAAARNGNSPPNRPHEELLAALRSPFNRRTRSWTLDALLDLPIGIAGFVYVTVLLTLGVGMAVTVLGFPILAAVVLGGRGWAAAERARAAVLLDERICAPPAPRWLPGSLGWIRTGLSDAPGWKALLYLVLLFPLGTLTFTLTVTLWALALGAITHPFWYVYLPQGAAPRLWENAYLDTFGESLLMVAIGVVALYLTPALLRGITDIRRAFVRGLLGDDSASDVNRATP